MQKRLKHAGGGKVAFYLSGSVFKSTYVGNLGRVNILRSGIRVRDGQISYSMGSRQNK